MKAPSSSPNSGPDGGPDTVTPNNGPADNVDRPSLTVVPGPSLSGPSWGRRDAPPDAYPRVAPAPPRPEGHPDEAGPGHRRLGPGLEVSLVVAARTGDIQAYECLVRSHRSDLVRLGVWLLADGGDAQDAVQDTLVLAWRRLPTLREPRLFRAWLYQIMTRRCLQMLRRRSDQRVSLSWDGDMAADRRGTLVADPADGPAERAQLTAIDTALSRALRQLPVDQRDVWVLRELHHQSYTEIAGSTGSTVSTVRGRLARARRRLPAALAAWR